jgi:hypothetical protein
MPLLFEARARSETNLEEPSCAKATSLSRYVSDFRTLYFRTGPWREPRPGVVACPYSPPAPFVTDWAAKKICAGVLHTRADVGTCVYRKLKPARNRDEARQGLGVN